MNPSPKRLFLPLFALLLAALACGEAAPDAPPPPEGTCPDCAIQSARVADEYVSIPFVGDLWATTWADDDRLYTAFGDGTGMNKCLPTLLMDEPDEFDSDYTEVSPGLYTVPSQDNEYCEVFGCQEPLPLCPYTPVGLVALEGSVPDFAPCEGPDQCIVSRYIPYGDYAVFENSDKPSSLIFVAGRMIMPLHYPPGEPTYGYLAYSEDYGRTWRALPDSPWGADSPFKVLMFINMGPAYGLNQDGYLYGLGIGDEIASPPQSQDVYLTRVPVEAALDYAAYEYFTGLDENGTPAWSPDPGAAAPLDGLRTMAQAAAIYHPGAGRYLFLSGLLEPDGTGGLFEAAAPWGPWTLSATFPAGFIPGIIPKDAGPDSFYFTAAGGGGVTYNLNIGRMQMTLKRPAQTPPLFSVIRTRKVEQIIGDWDFETLQPTRQQTESRFNVAFTDLGSPFEHQGKLYLLFGDTDPEAPGWDERHDDTIGYTEAQAAQDFRLTFLTDPQAGRGVLNPKIACPQENNPDCVDLGALNVPVAGLSDGDTVFVWFTADAASRSLLARTDDDFRTFQKVYDFGETHFIDIAVQRYEGQIPGLAGEGPWALIFGSGNKANNHVYLAAATLESLRQGDRDGVRFLSGVEYPAQGPARLTWSPNEADSVAIFEIEHGPGPGVMSEVPHGWGFGEPLVHYSEQLGLWLATYNAARTTIRLRSAEQPWGPWSASIVLFDPARDYGWGPAYGRYIGDGENENLGGQGELYGPYILPRFTRVLADGRVKLYWLLSTWQPYVVVMMESVLGR